MRLTFVLLQHWRNAAIVAVILPNLVIRPLVPVMSPLFLFLLTFALCLSNQFHLNCCSAFIHYHLDTPPLPQRVFNSAALEEALAIAATAAEANAVHCSLHCPRLCLFFTQSHAPN